MRGNLLLISLIAFAVDCAAQLTLEDRLRQLGEPPDPAREQAQKALDHRLEKVKRLESILPALTGEKMRGLLDSDPLLYQLYGYRINGDYQATQPWQIVIDADLRTRESAGELCSRLLAKPTDSNDRFGVLDWLYNNSDVHWAHRILDEAVMQYNDGKDTWEFPDVRSLARLVSKIGDARHIDMLKEMQKKYSVGMEELILRRRLNMSDSIRSDEASSNVVATSSRGNQRDPVEGGALSDGGDAWKVGWVFGAAGLLFVSGLIWILLKRRRN